jgi:hypothetical protein
MRDSSFCSAKRQRQSGFAIGIVFLVLVLIGVILASMTLMSGNSQNTSRDTENRSAGNGVIRDGSNLVAAVGTLINTNSVRIEQVYAYRDNPATVVTCTNSTNDSNAYCLYRRGENLFGPNGTLPFPQINPAAYQAVGTGAACTQTIFATEAASATDDSNLSCLMYVTRVKTSNFGQAGAGLRDSTYLVYTGPLTQAVGQQINNILWDSGFATAAPALTAGPFVLKKLAPTAILRGATGLVDVNTNVVATAAGTPANIALPTINAAVRPEGVYRYNTTATPTQPVSIYYKVISSI